MPLLTLSCLPGPGAQRRRSSLPAGSEAEALGRRPSKDETEQRLKKWEQSFNQKQAERSKTIGQAPLLPASVTNTAPRRSSFSILDWKTGDDEKSPGPRRRSLDSGQKSEPRPPAAKKDPLNPPKPDKDRRSSSTMRKSMSLVREEDEYGEGGGYIASLENLSEVTSVENIFSESSELSSSSQPENIFAMIKKRRGSLPMGSVEQLRTLAEVRPASEVIAEINETTTPESSKGSWRISAKHLKSNSMTQSVSLENFVATNPLFNVQNLDFTQTPEKEELFKKKFDTLSKQKDRNLEQKDP